MADVFISYSVKDRAAARRIALALEGEGLSIWWDYDLRAGESFDEVIERNLREASCVVVLWSCASVDSKWVRAEASFATDRGVYLPARIEACELPVRFRLVQTADLEDWSGDETNTVWMQFAASVKKMAAEHRAPTADSDQLELAYWTSIQGSAEAKDFSSYLRRYPDGRYTAQARNRLRSLRRRLARRLMTIGGAVALVAAISIGGWMLYSQGARSAATARETREASAERDYYVACRDDHYANACTDYLTRYPEGVYADLARGQREGRAAPLPEDADAREGSADPPPANPAPAPASAPPAAAPPRDDEPQANPAPPTRVVSTPTPPARPREGPPAGGNVTPGLNAFSGHWVRARPGEGGEIRLTAIGSSQLQLQYNTGSAWVTAGSYPARMLSSGRLEVTEASGRRMLYILSGDGGQLTRRDAAVAGGASDMLYRRAQ